MIETEASVNSAAFLPRAQGSLDFTDEESSWSPSPAVSSWGLRTVGVRTTCGLDLVLGPLGLR